jgi:hypothetical protein
MEENMMLDYTSIINDSREFTQALMEAWIDDNLMDEAMEAGAPAPINSTNPVHPVGQQVTTNTGQATTPQQVTSPGAQKKISRREAKADPNRKVKVDKTAKTMAVKLHRWNGTIITLFNNASTNIQNYQKTLAILMKKRTPKPNVEAKSFTYDYTFLSNAWGIFNQDIQAAIQDAAGNPNADPTQTIDVLITEIANKMGLNESNVRTTENLTTALKNQYRGEKATKNLSAAQVDEYKAIIDSFYQDSKNLRAVPYAMMRNWDTIMKNLDQSLQQQTASTTETNKGSASRIRKVSELFSVYQHVFQVVANLLIERALDAKAVLGEFYKVGVVGKIAGVN